MKTSLCRALFGLVALIVLAGCSSISDCLEPQPYMQAKQMPPLASPPGLDVPPPDPDMQIPDVGSGPIGDYEQPIKGRPDSVLAHCLIAPPAMPKTGV